MLHPPFVALLEVAAVALLVANPVDLLVVRNLLVVRILAQGRLVQVLVVLLA